MAMTFINDHKQCVCGSRSFTQQPVYAYKIKANGKMIPYDAGDILITCANCSKQELIKKEQLE